MQVYFGYNSGQMWKRWWARFLRLWAAFRQVSAVRSLLQWIGRWQAVIALASGILAWVWSRVKHLPAPLQLVVGLGVFTFVLVCIKIVVSLRDRAQRKSGEQAAALARAKAQELPANRPQLRIVRWGQIDPAKAARGAHTIQQGFYIANFGLGETAVGVEMSLIVPTEVPDEWTNGGSAANAIIVGKDDGEVFVPIWRKIGGFGSQGVLARFDLPSFLINVYNGKFGNQKIPVTIKYSSNGKNYVTLQSLIYSPEQRYISGFGVPEQRLEDSPSSEVLPSPSNEHSSPTAQNVAVQSEPEPTLLSLLDRGFPNVGSLMKTSEITFQDETKVELKSRLFFEFNHRARFLGFYLPTSPKTVEAIATLAMQTREIAEQIAKGGLNVIARNLDENPEEIASLTFTGKVYIHHEDRLTHRQIADAEDWFKAQNLVVVFRGPDFLMRARIAWKNKQR